MIQQKIDLEILNFFVAVLFESGEGVSEKSTFCTRLKMLTIIDGP